MTETVFVIDDGEIQCEILGDILRREGYEVVALTDPKEALERIGQMKVNVVITDLKMPQMDGMEILKEVKGLDTNTAVIVVTAYGTIETAVESMKLGAFDYLTKPLQKEEVKIVVKKALETQRLASEVSNLRQELEDRYRFDNIIGGSPKMREVYRIIEKVASCDSTVMIYGASGTGKELVAKALHYNSPRKNRRFVPIDCASFPETLLESELFGYERGAFTGAFSRKIGLFEEADEGTLFLDEIADLSLNTQAKLLRAIQEKKIKRLGGTKSIDVDVRIISATNRDLEKLLSKGSFREDLYYRVNVIHIFLPPLTERKEDIPLLINHFLDKHKVNGRKRMDQSAMNLLMRYNWPGNVRELESVVMRAILLGEGETILPQDLPQEIRSFSTRGRANLGIPEEGLSLDGVERELIHQALKKAGWNRRKAAKLLGLTYKTFLYRMEKFNIRRPSTSSFEEIPPDEEFNLR